MQTRYLFIIIAVAVIAILALGAFWFFLHSQPAAPSAPGSTGNLPRVNTSGGNGTTGNGPVGGAGQGQTGAGVLPSINTGLPTGTVRFGIVSNDPVVDYFVDKQNTVTMVEPDGKIAQVTNGQVTYLSSTQIQNLLAGSFSYDGTKILVNFGDPAKPQTSLFNVAAKAWTPLPVGIASPVWSPSDYRIAYMKTNADGSMSVMTVDTSKASAKPAAVLNLNIQDAMLAWPNKTQVVLSDKPSISSLGAVWVFNIQKQTLSQPVAPAYGASSLWSRTTSSVALFFGSQNMGHNGGLSLWNPAAPTSSASLTFLTLPSKCAFNSEAAATAMVGTTTVAIPPYLGLYCAVPTDSSLSSANGPLPDSYNEKSFFSADNFIRVHTDSGAIDSLFSPGVAVDATDLNVANRMLFFVNRYDEKLYAVSLPAPGQ